MVVGRVKRAEYHGPVRNMQCYRELSGMSGQRTALRKRAGVIAPCCREVLLLLCAPGPMGCWALHLCLAGTCGCCPPHSSCVFCVTCQCQQQHQVLGLKARVCIP